MYLHIVYLLLISSAVFGFSITHSPSTNETELIGQITAPHGSPLRNLSGLVLFLNILHHNTSIHHSYNRITNTTFPLHYSIVLSERDFSHENAKDFSLKTAILQPIFIHQSEVKINKNKITTYNFEIEATKSVIIHGKILNAKSANESTNLPGRHVKLELIQADNDEIIHEIDFTCQTKTYPCPFEYILDSSLFKLNAFYRLLAFLGDHHVPSRKSIHHHHDSQIIVTETTNSSSFTINPTGDTKIDDYHIFVDDINVKNDKKFSLFK